MLKKYHLSNQDIQEFAEAFAYYEYSENEIGMVKALGLSGFTDVVKKFQTGGASLERTYRKEKKDFIQVELLAIKKEHQGKGYMRSLMETAIELASQKHLPFLTDAYKRWFTYQTALHVQ